jgi:hypothetical protein
MNFDLRIIFITVSALSVSPSAAPTLLQVAVVVLHRTTTRSVRHSLFAIQTRRSRPRRNICIRSILIWSILSMLRFRQATQSSMKDPGRRISQFPMIQATPIQPEAVSCMITPPRNRTMKLQRTGHNRPLTVRVIRAASARPQFPPLCLP